MSRVQLGDKARLDLYDICTLLEAVLETPVAGWSG